MGIRGASKRPVSATAKLLAGASLLSAISDHSGQWRRLAVTPLPGPLSLTASAVGPSTNLNSPAR
jgi:hypothetical protein